MGLKAPNQSMPGNGLSNGAGHSGTGGAGGMSPPNQSSSNGDRNGSFPQGSRAGGIAPPNANLKFNAATSKMPLGNAAAKPSAGAIPVDASSTGGAMGTFYRKS